MSALLAIAVAVAAAAPTPRSVIIWTEVNASGRADVANDVEISGRIESELAFFSGLELVSKARAFRSQIVDTRRACNTDVTCIGRELQDKDVDLGIIVSVDGGVVPPRISATLIERNATRAASSVDDGASGAAIMSIAGGLVRRLLVGSGATLGGIIEIDVRPADALVVVTPESQPQSARSYVMPPGRYQVHASRPGHLDENREIEVVAGERLRVALELEAIEPLTASPWFWTITAAVVIAAATTVSVIALRPRDYVVCIGNEDTCR